MRASPREMYAYGTHVQEGSEEPCYNSTLAKDRLSPPTGQLSLKEWANGGSHFPVSNSVHMYLKITHNFLLLFVFLFFGNIKLNAYFNFLYNKNSPNYKSIALKDI